MRIQLKDLKVQLAEKDALIAQFQSQARSQDSSRAVAELTNQFQVELKRKQDDIVTLRQQLIVAQEESRQLLVELDRYEELIQSQGGHQLLHPASEHDESLQESDREDEDPMLEVEEEHSGGMEEQDLTPKASKSASQLDDIVSPARSEQQKQQQHQQHFDESAYREEEVRDEQEEVEELVQDEQLDAPVQEEEEEKEMAEGMCVDLMEEANTAESMEVGYDETPADLDPENHIIAEEALQRHSETLSDSESLSDSEALSGLGDVDRSPCDNTAATTTATTVVPSHHEMSDEEAMNVAETEAEVAETPVDVATPSSQEQDEVVDTLSPPLQEELACPPPAQDDDDSTTYSQSQSQAQVQAQEEIVTTIRTQQPQEDIEAASPMEEETTASPLDSSSAKRPNDDDHDPATAGKENDPTAHASAVVVAAGSPKKKKRKLRSKKAVFDADTGNDQHDDDAPLSPASQAFRKIFS